MTVAAQQDERLGLSVLGIGLRFLTSGLLALACGLLWSRSTDTRHLTIVPALVGVLSLLIGFIVGGGAWYVADRRRHSNDTTRTFSLVVFVGIPAFVLVLVLALWLLSIALASA